jgi:hypothetical protein
MPGKRKHEGDETLGVTARGKAFKGSENPDKSENIASELPPLSVETLQDIYKALSATTLVQQPLLEGNLISRNF